MFKNSSKNEVKGKNKKNKSKTKLQGKKMRAGQTPKSQNHSIAGTPAQSNLSSNSSSASSTTASSSTVFNSSSTIKRRSSNEFALQEATNSLKQQLVDAEKTVAERHNRLDELVVVMAALNTQNNALRRKQIQLDPIRAQAERMTYDVRKLEAELESINKVLEGPEVRLRELQKSQKKAEEAYIDRFELRPHRLSDKVVHRLGGLTKHDLELEQQGTTTTTMFSLPGVGSSNNSVLDLNKSHQLLLSEDEELKKKKKKKVELVLWEPAPPPPPPPVVKKSKSASNKNKKKSKAEEEQEEEEDDEEEEEQDPEVIEAAKKAQEEKLRDEQEEADLRERENEENEFTDLLQRSGCGARSQGFQDALFQSTMTVLEPPPQKKNKKRRKSLTKNDAEYYYYYGAEEEEDPEELEEEERAARKSALQEQSLKHQAAGSVSSRVRAETEFVQAWQKRHTQHERELDNTSDVSVVTQYSSSANAAAAGGAGATSARSRKTRNIRERFKTDVWREF